MWMDEWTYMAYDIRATTLLAENVLFYIIYFTYTMSYVPHMYLRTKLYIYRYKARDRHRVGVTNKNNAWLYYIYSIMYVYEHVLYGTRTVVVLRSSTYLTYLLQHRKVPKAIWKIDAMVLINLYSSFYMLI